MKNLSAMLGVLILSGLGLATADQTMAQTGKLVNSEINTNANVNTSAHVNTEVGKENQVEVNAKDSDAANAKADLQANYTTIHQVRADMVRDIKKLKRDRVRLKTAVDQKDNQTADKIKADIDKDETTIHKDRVNLKNNLQSKVESDRATISEYSQKVRDTRKVVEKDNDKLTRETAKLADAQKRNASDDIAKFQAAVDKDKSVLAADTEKLNKRIEYKADMRTALKNDRHHLEVEVKHLAEDKASASASEDVESEESTK